jgi:Protein of unknown function (DUF2852)
MSCTWSSASPAERNQRWEPAEIAVMVAGFVIFWPIGLLVIGIKKGWLGLDRWDFAQRQMQRLADLTRKDKGTGGSWHSALASDSGNSAFDAYKAKELERLEAGFQELAKKQQEFEAFLQRLRESKDRAEFENFMNERPDKAK